MERWIQGWPAGGVNHFLTERFDRQCGRKIHTVTLRALAGEVNSYEDVFKVCRKLRLPYHDMEQLYRRAVFNYLTGVCDDHDKNFSFSMFEDGSWRLSPAYDVTFTVNYKNLFIGDRHNMTIDGGSRIVNRDQLLRLADENDVRNANDIIGCVTDAAKNFEAKAVANNINREYIQLISDFINRQSALLD